MIELSGGVLLRPLEVADAAELLAVHERNRERLRRSSPEQPASFWTLAGQVERLETIVRRREAGEGYGCGLFDGARILGCVTLNSIVRGPFCNASIGYWIDAGAEGKGLTSEAVAAMLRLAEQELGLHRIEASTNPENLASQRVLAKNGFVPIGRAPNYLYLDGAWRESLLFQRILHDRPPAAGSA